jgi:hypothetical protein
VGEPGTRGVAQRRRHETSIVPAQRAVGAI